MKNLILSRWKEQMIQWLNIQKWLFICNIFLSNNNYDKVNFFSTKFMEKYGRYWSCCFTVEGGLKMFYFDYYIRLEYKNYGIYIWQSSK